MNCKLDLRFNISISSVEHRMWINSQNRNTQYLIIDQGAVTVRVDLMRVSTCQTTEMLCASLRRHIKDVT